MVHAAHRVEVHFVFSVGSTREYTVAFEPSMASRSCTCVTTDCVTATTTSALGRLLRTTLIETPRAVNEVGVLVRHEHEGDAIHTPSSPTEASVRAIRASTETTAALARRYGVSESTVQSARTGHTWSWPDQGDEV